MNYIAEINAFYNKLEIDSLSTGQIALWHALMHINNKCSWTEWFTVANKVLEINTKLTRDGIAKARNVLKQKGFIDFRSNGTNATSYMLISLCSMQSSIQASIQASIQDSIQDSIQASIQGSIQSCIPLNKQNKTKQNNKEKVKKEKYGEYQNVLLTEKEYTSLKSDYAHADELIKFLDEYIEMKGYKARSHYLAIKKWVVSAVAERKPLVHNQINDEAKQADRERQKKWLQSQIEAGVFDDAKHGSTISRY